MYCLHCGQLTQQRDRFCHVCGALQLSNQTKRSITSVRYFIKEWLTAIALLIVFIGTLAAYLFLPHIQYKTIDVASNSPAASSFTLTDVSVMTYPIIKITAQATPRLIDTVLQNPHQLIILDENKSQNLSYITKNNDTTITIVYELQNASAPHLDERHVSIQWQNTAFHVVYDTPKPAYFTFEMMR